MAQSSLGSPGLLSAGVSQAGDVAADRSFARDLNLDQIVAAIAGDREERDLITTVLFGPLHDAGAVLAVKDPLPTSFGEDLYYRLGGWLEEDRTPTSAAAAATGR